MIYGFVCIFKEVYFSIIPSLILFSLITWVQFIASLESAFFPLPSTKYQTQGPSLAS